MDGSIVLGSGPGSVSGGVRRQRPRRDRRTVLTLAIVVAMGISGMADATYVVTRGDNLTRIARRHGSTPREIARVNGIPNPNLIFIGQRLRIPGARGGGAPTRATTVHTVSTGENLTLIAHRYGATIAGIARASGLSNPNLIFPGQRLKIPTKAAAPSQRARVEALLEKYSRAYGVDPALVKAMAWHESGWKPHVVSKAGAVGVMQVLPQTGDFVSRHLLGGAPVDLRSAESNVRAGVRFLAFLIQAAGGDEHRAVAGYFQGLRSVNHNGLYPATERYLANVMALRKRFGG